MKKLVYYIICSFILTIGIISCDDNSDFSSLHELTQEEKDEIARQDSIDSVRRSKIDADLILEYTVNVTISQTLFDGTYLNIDLDKIAELFGITEEEVLAGIAGESGAPEVKGFAIEGTTHIDNATKTNTNGPWGHWWNAKGDVQDYDSGVSAITFTEFDTEKGRFHVGQFPAALTHGQTIKVIEGLKYRADDDDKDRRAAIVITIVAQNPGEITATVVNTQDLSINVNPKSNYNTAPLEFDWELTKNNLGISSPDDLKTLGVKQSGYAQENNAGNKGFWFDMEGYAGDYGDNSGIFTSFDESEDGGYNIGIGQYPDRLEVGDVITVKYGLMANNKIEMLKITITVVAYEDPETPPAGSPTTIEKNISLTKAWSDDYARVEEDIKEVLRDAFKMTTYQIHKAIATKDLKAYLGEVTADDPEYTSDAPGYWIKADGSAGEWAEGLVWCSIGNNETELYLYGGNHPGNSVAGNVVSTKMIVTCNGGQAIFNITFNITE